MPKSVQRWVTRASTSTNEPASRRSSMRSRAVSLPASCCLRMRSSPPPRSAAASRLRRSSIAWVRAIGGGVYPREIKDIKDVRDLKDSKDPEGCPCCPLGPLCPLCPLCPLAVHYNHLDALLRAG